ncbi:MAG: hypothetical protein PHZ26_01560 [Candidatus Gracilibacteria bacterium]|nr:hypothetical protein [Candidatus Gracilibacteria bacterium]MDD2908420.1 hypothetical protein [Candidatus Gracilibacteria bacterium]
MLEQNYFGNENVIKKENRAKPNCKIEDLDCNLSPANRFKLLRAEIESENKY